MKKTLLLAAGLLFSTITLSANSSGEEIFKAKCSACHLLQPPSALHQPGTPAFKEAMNNLKAPPMAKITQMIKMHYEGKEAFVTFMTDYITKPDASKTVCMQQAVKGFGLMPAMGDAMSDEEKKVVAAWIYDNVKATQMTRNMKCGEGKCGAGMMKNAPKKQGAMKCAAGKCGSK